jgi:hypothetical protein
MVNIEPGSRNTQFYVIYNLETLEPHFLTTLESVDIPDGFAKSTVDPVTGEEFINHKKHLHRYFVIDHNGTAEFHPIVGAKRLTRKYYQKDHYIKDLNPSNTTFNQLGIMFRLIDNKINLSTDVNAADPFIKSFLAGISKNYKLYITKYGDNNCLICSLEFNLHKLIEDKLLSIEVDIDKEHISLWATV